MPGGAVPEMAKALENLQAVLEAAGSGVDKVVKATIFVEDLGDFANINEEYKKGETKSSTHYSVSFDSLISYYYLTC